MCFILHQSKSMRRASGSSDACVCFSACQATQTAESEEPPQDRSGRRAFPADEGFRFGVRV